MLLLWTGADSKEVKRLLRPLEGSLSPAALPTAVSLSAGHLVLPGPGDVVIAMGNKAVDILRAHGLVPKGRTLTALREKPIKAGEGWIVVSNDPYASLSDPAVEALIQWDIRLADRLMTQGNIEPAIGSYAWVEDFSGVRAYIEQKFAQTGRPFPVSLDLETMGLFPYYADKKIVTVQVSVEEGHSDVVYVPDLSPAGVGRLIEDLRWLLNTPMVKLRGSNLKFDLVWLYVKWMLECTNFTFDTTIVGSLLNENRSNSLNNHAKVYTAMGGYDDSFGKKYDKGKMELIPKDDLLQYAGGDTDATLRVSNVMVPLLSAEPALARFYTTVLHPAARAFEKIEARGVCVNRGKLEALGDKLDVRIAELEKQAVEMMPRRLRLKHMAAINDPNGSALSKPSILKDFFFSPMGLNLKPKVVTEKTKEPSTAKDHLLMFSDDPAAKAFVEIYEQWGSATKTKSTYVEGFLKHLRPDSRFHPSYMLFNGMMDDKREGGTNTGRLSAKDPAVQTIPKHTFWAKDLRDCYDAPPGMVAWEVDFDQGELKITADVSCDTHMLEAYLAGRDLHMQTGGMLAGMTYDDMLALKEFAKGTPEAALFKTTRQKAKAANFGLIYRISVDGYMEFARKTYFVILTREEAEMHFKQFFGLYDRLHPWHDEYVNHARKYGWVVSPMGRVRHLPLINSRDSRDRGTAERQAINAPIQGCLSDMGLFAIGILSEQYPDLWISGMTHDAVAGYCPEDEVELWMGRIAGTMSNLPLHEVGWTPKLQFTATAEAGPTWATMTEVPT